MKITVNDQLAFSEFQPSDSAALVRYLNDRDIYDRTLRIPFPYTEKHAEEYFALIDKATVQQGRPVQWAIRDAADALIGGCGFDGFQLGKSHAAEIGYWTAKPFWGRGIMTAVLERICRYAFDEFGLVKITAHVFAHNPASARVLEKCGFQQEGFLRKHYLKEGAFIDAKLYALLKS